MTHNVITYYVYITMYIYICVYKSEYIYIYMYSHGHMFALLMARLSFCPASSSVLPRADLTQARGDDVQRERGRHAAQQRHAEENQ